MAIREPLDMLVREPYYARNRGECVSVRQVVAQSGELEADWGNLDGKSGDVRTDE
jgi:hypothetical protein